MMNNLLNEDLARAQMSARLGEAQQLRRGRQQAAARRLSRKAEQAARQARLALARAICGSTAFDLIAVFWSPVRHPSYRAPAHFGARSLSR